MALLSASLKEEFTDSVKEAWLWLWAFLTRSMAQVRSPRALKRATYRTHSPPVLATRPACPLEVIRFPPGADSAEAAHAGDGELQRAGVHHPEQLGRGHGPLFRVSRKLQS